jgi:hypothetical protein
LLPKSSPLGAIVHFPFSNSNYNQLIIIMDKNTIELENVSFDLEGQPSLRNDSNIHRRNVVKQEEDEPQPQ